MLSVALRLLACSAVTYGAWLIFGPVGIVWCSPLYGAAFARPLMNAFGSTYEAMRARVYRDVNGHYYAYRDIPISVTEDSAGYQWLRLSDVRKVLPELPKDEFFRQNLGSGVRQFPPDRAHRILAETLLTYLGRTRNLETAKFTTWLERTVVNPSQKRRQRGRLPDNLSKSP